MEWELTWTPERWVGRGAPPSPLRAQQSLLWAPATKTCLQDPDFIATRSRGTPPLCEARDTE